MSVPTVQALNPSAWDAQALRRMSERRSAGRSLDNDPSLRHSALVTADWQGMDALLLEVIAGPGKRGADLRTIIHMADYIDRMVFHFHEIDGSLRRLVGSALVTPEGNQFRPTRTASEIRSRAPRGSVYDRLKWTLSYLDERVACTSSTNWSLDPVAYESALVEYQAEMRAAIDRMK